MKRKATHQRPSLASTVFFVVFALLLAAPVQAQDGGRMRILIPALEGDGGRGNSGDQVADQIRRRVEGMPRHVPVSKDEYETALKQVERDKEDMRCLDNRQLAAFMQVPLVMCGTLERVPDGGLRVAMQVISSETGETFDISSFEAPNREAVADHVVQAFEGYVQFLTQVDNCATYRDSGQPQLALENCQAALAANPNATSVEYLTAHVLMDLERYQESYDMLQRILEENPTHQDALLTAGIAASRLGNNDVAMGHFRRYLELNPGNVQVRLSVAIDVNREGNPQGALDIAEEGLAHAPDDLTLVEYAGHFALNAAQQAQTTSSNGEAAPFLEKSLGYYTRVYEAEGNESDALMLRNMVRANLLLERVTEAADIGTEAVAIDPEDAELWSAYADALQRAGRTDDALAALDKVRELEPSTPRITYRRGVLLVNAERLDDAVAAFREAIRLNEVSADEAAAAIFGYAVNSKWQQNQRAAAVPYLLAAREMAESPQRKGGPSYFLAVQRYNQGLEVQPNENQTFEGAQKALPLFTEARQYIQDARPWAATQAANVQSSVNQIAQALDQLIEIQELLIQQGRR